MKQSFYGGVHPNDRKELARHKEVAPLSAAPKQVVIAMAMHVGAPCKPIVAVGDQVKVVVHCTGDGCFRMNCHELCTAEHYNIPVITVIFNNRTLGMVRQWQNLIYQKRFSQTDLDRGPDFVKLAEAYGIQGERAATQPEFEAAFRRAVAAGRPYLIECAIDKDAMVHPMVSAGAPVTDFILD